MLLKRKTLGLLLGTAAFAAVLLLPTPNGMSVEAKRMLALALLMTVWWITEAVPLAVTALLPVPLFPLLHIMPSSQVAVNYTNHLIFLFIGGFMIAAAIQKWNLHKRIALNVIKTLGTNPKKLLLGFMCATALLAMWVSNTATALMILPIGIAVIVQMSEGVSYEDKTGIQTQILFKNNFGQVLMLGIAYSASIGGLGTLIGTPPNIVFAGFINELYPNCPEIGFTQWMAVGVPLIIILLPIVWFVLIKKGSKIPLSKFKFSSDQNSDVIKNELKAIGRMKRPEISIAVVFGITVFLWVFRNPIKLGFTIIPGWGDLFPQSYSGYLHDTTVAMLMAVILFLVPVNLKKRKFLLDWRTARAKIPWGIVLLFGGGFALASGFKETGLDKWIGSHLGLLGGLPVILTILIVCLLVTFLTEVTSNTATATMLMPILAATSVGLGQHPFLLMIPATISASCAFMLPVATPPNAIVFGSGWIDIGKMARIGLILNLIGAAIITTLAYLLIVLVFGIKAGVLPPWIP